MKKELPNCRWSELLGAWANEPPSLAEVRRTLSFYSEEKVAPADYMALVYRLKCRITPAHLAVAEAIHDSGGGASPNLEASLAPPNQEPYSPSLNGWNAFELCATPWGGNDNSFLGLLPFWHARGDLWGDAREGLVGAGCLLMTGDNDTRRGAYEALLRVAGAEFLYSFRAGGLPLIEIPVIFADEPWLRAWIEEVGLDPTPDQGRGSLLHCLTLNCTAEQEAEGGAKHCLAVASLLLTHGVDPTVRDKNGRLAHELTSAPILRTFLESICLGSSPTAVLVRRTP